MVCEFRKVFLARDGQTVVLTALCQKIRLRTLNPEVAVPKSPKEVADKVQEIFAQARGSDTPISLLSLQSTILLGKDDWTPGDVERVSGEVLDLLIQHGWKKTSA
jgi:hypothetical protein